MKRIVDIKLQPLAWHVLKRQYVFDGTAVELGSGWLYKMVTLCLRRNPVMSPWEFSRIPQGLTEGKVYISESDYNRYGGYMSMAKQASLSLVICRRERERLYSLTATAHVMGGIPRDTAMRYFLEKEGYEESEISFAALRKDYQRHYRHIEEDIYNDFNQLNIQKRNKTTQ